MSDVIRKALHLIGRESRGRWILLVVFAAFASGLEMLGAMMVFVLLAVIADPTGTIDIPVIGDLRRYVADVDQSTLLIWLTIGMGIFFLLRLVVHVAVSYAQKRVAFMAGATVAKRLVLAYLGLPYAWHLRINSTELIRTAMAAATNVVQSAFLPLIRVTADGILALALLTVMFLVSPLASVLAIVVVGAAAGLLLMVVQPRLKRFGKMVYHLQQVTLSSLSQAFQGMRDIKLLGREHYFSNVYARSVDELARASYLRGTVTELPRHVMETAMVGFILAYFGIAVMSGLASDQILSVLGLFAYVGLRLQPSLNRIIASLNELKFASASVDGVYNDLVHTEGITIPEQAARALPLNRELVVEDVTFRYEGANVDALTDVNMTIRPGETVGVCGPTGGGKTTLVDLISGLLEPTSGRITVDGHDLRDHSREWQRNLGAVAQMGFLTDDSLRRNIALGVPDDQIDEAAIANAVGLAQLHDFLLAAPDGLDTTVGEQGVRVSGGQRQRVAIARALYRRADVLIFDEGTSALDNTTEAMLMDALQTLRGDHTIILVAHRLSTVQDCDKIAYIEGGRLAAFGTYDELLHDSQGFRDLAEAR